MKRLVLALALGLGAIVGFAQPAAQAQLPAGMELGPKIGAKVPAFAVTGPDGQAHDLKSLSGKSGVTLVFYRSADWCPFCKLQLQNLNGVADELAAAGWPLVGISYDPAATLTAFSEANGLKYPLMTDPGSKAIDAFGLRNEAMNGKARFEGIPHPIILFVAADGSVKAKLYEEAYQKRPPADLVLSTVKGFR